MKQFLCALKVTFFLTFVCGLIYPLFVTVICRIAFPFSAEGSLVVKNEVVQGSTLLGQSFSDPSNFHGRPSATSPVAYNPAASSGSNLALSNPAFQQALADRITALHGSHENPVPIDLVTTSGSGLDPHITVQAARFQVQRIAKARGVSVQSLQKLIDDHAEGLAFFSPRYVNVFELNRTMQP